MGAPRIHGAPLMLGIEMAQSTVGNYMDKLRGPTSQGWKTFLCNHAAAVASLDLLVRGTITFKLLYGLLILAHGRRRLAGVSVTSPSNRRVACRTGNRCLPLEWSIRLIPEVAARDMED